MQLPFPDELRHKWACGYLLKLRVIKRLLQISVTVPGCPVVTAVNIFVQYFGAPYFL
jgi:hypothetical protein